MRYVDPEKVLHGHAKQNKIPKWDVAVMCFHSIEKTCQIVEKLGGVCLNYRLFSKCDEKMVFETEIEGYKIGILGWCTGGGPLVASLIEELKVTGVRWIIGIGAAASINKNIRKNELIVPDKLIVNDGLSKWYTQNEVVTIDKTMNFVIKNLLQKKSYQPFQRVIGATIEALYRQDEYMLEPLRKQGAEVVNWELTPFYATTEYNNIHSVWIGHVSDIEYNGIWDDWFIDRTESLNLCIMLCIDLIKHIARSEIDEDKFKNNNTMSGGLPMLSGETK